ncbi:MAG TPA: hypothetical protein VFZ89_19885 [Solirubrobacteraceae bacterium]
MAAMAWVMMALALWHFAIWLPDRFWGGIAGAFVGALIGGLVSGFVLRGFTVPGNDDLELIDAFVSLPGAILGMGLFYLEGMRRDRLSGESSIGSVGTR